MGTTSIERVAEQVQAARDYLTGEGWEQISEVGDLGSPDGHFVWFSSGYSYGEFTLTASIRQNGAGPALHQIRYRLTEIRSDADEDLALRLVMTLDAAAGRISRALRDGIHVEEAVGNFWPPNHWDA